MVRVSQGQPVWAMGLMSGTSMDGVDAAMVLTDGETIGAFGPGVFVEYDARYRAEMAAANAVAPGTPTEVLRDAGRWPAALTMLAESAVTVHLEAIGRCSGAPDVVGSPLRPIPQNGSAEGANTLAFAGDFPGSARSSGHHPRATRTGGYGRVGACRQDSPRTPP